MLLSAYELLVAHKVGAFPGFCSNKQLQEKITGQRGRLLVQSLGYGMSTRVIFR